MICINNNEQSGIGSTTPSSDITNRKLLMSITIYQHQLDTHLETVISSLKAGESLLQLCKKYSINYHAFRKVIKRDYPTLLSMKKSKQMRERMSASTRKFSPDEEQHIIERYMAGESAYQILKDYDVVVNVIYSILKRNNIPKNNQSSYWTDEMREKQRQLCYDGIVGIHAQGDGAYRFTKPERDFAKWCEDNTIAYERQFQITKGTHRYDFIISDTNILVEIDGEYWHSTPEQTAKDRSFEEYAIDNGYAVIRFTDKEMRKTKNNCLQALKSLI